MKTRKIKFLALTLIFVMAVGVLTACNQGSSVSLDDFKSDGKYQYAKTSWGSSSDEVKKALPYSIEEDTYRKPETVDTVFYNSKDTVTVNGEKAKATFEFNADRLRAVQFYFDASEDNCKEVFEKQSKSMLEKFGSENEKLENSSNNIDNIGYMWKSGNTQLQFSMMSGNSIEPVVVVTLVDRDIIEQ